MIMSLQAFPYSVSFVKLLNPEGQLYPSAYYDELSQMIDSLNRPSVYNRQRRDMAEPVKSKSKTQSLDRSMVFQQP